MKHSHTKLYNARMIKDFLCWKLCPRSRKLSHIRGQGNMWCKQWEGEHILRNRPVSLSIIKSETVILQLQ